MSDKVGFLFEKRLGYLRVSGVLAILRQYLQFADYNFLRNDSASKQLLVSMLCLFTRYTFVALNIITVCRAAAQGRYAQQQHFAPAFVQHKLRNHRVIDDSSSEAARAQLAEQAFDGGRDRRAVGDCEDAASLNGKIGDTKFSVSDVVSNRRHPRERIQ